MANILFVGDRVLQRHVEEYQHVPEIQPAHRQDVDSYWADKIAEVMRDLFGIKAKVNTYSYRKPYPPTRCQILLNSLGKMTHQQWNMSIASSSSVERLLIGMS